MTSVYDSVTLTNKYFSLYISEDFIKSFEM